MLSPFIPVLGLLLSCIAVTWLLLKSRSLHLFYVRIWNAVFDSTPVTDPVVKALVEYQTNLTAVHIFSDLRIDSLAELQQLDAWANARGIKLAQLSAIAPFFNLRTRCIELKRPALYSWLNVAGLLISILCAAIFYPLALESHANLRSPATGQWFWISADDARPSIVNLPIFPSGLQNFTPKQCNNARSATDVFRVADLEALCTFWQSENRDKSLQNWLLPQRLIFGFYALLFCFILMWLAKRRHQLQLVKSLEYKISLKF